MQGFIYYLYAKDFNKAAKYFEEASEKPALSDFRSSSIKAFVRYPEIVGPGDVAQVFLWSIPCIVNLDPETTWLVGSL